MMISPRDEAAYGIKDLGVIPDVTRMASETTTPVSTPPDEDTFYLLRRNESCVDKCILLIEATNTVAKET